MLKLVLPKGSLEKSTLELFDGADLAVSRGSSVDYRATIDDPRIEDVRILRPQEIPVYVADGLFDIGITGRDWIEETGSDVVSLGELHYSKATARPVRIVVAVAGDSPVESVADLSSGVRVSSEYPELTRRFFDERGVEADIQLSYGATEAKIPDIVDVVVDITETGSSLRANKLRIVDTLMTSTPRLIANHDSWKNDWKRSKIERLALLLRGALEAESKVGLKMNLPENRLAGLLKALPALRNPTISHLSLEGWVAVETVIDESVVREMIPQLKAAGAEGIIEYPLNKVVY